MKRNYKRKYSAEIEKLYKLKKDSFHKKIKPNILKNISEKERKIIGKNPDILLDSDGYISIQSTIKKQKLIELNKTIMEFI